MKKLLTQAGLCLGFLLVWHMVSTLTIPLFVPAPLDVFQTLAVQATEGTLFLALWYSFRRITVSVLLAAGCSLLVALCVQQSKIIRTILYPFIKLMRYLPATAFYPLLIMWFGIDEGMKTAFLFFVSFVYMMPSTMLAFEEVPLELIDTAITLGMTQGQVLTRVILPYSAPSIAKSFSLMYGIGWTYITVAEQVNAVHGLGFMISNAAARGRTNVVFAAILVILLISVLTDYFISKIISKVFRWRELL